MLLTICASCGRKHPQGQPCPCQKGRHKLYNDTRRDQGKNAFYHSAAWGKLATAIKSRAGGCDELIKYREGRLVPGTIVHHIMPIDERPDLRLDPSNLILLSARSHKEVHDRYNLGGLNKVAAQGELAMAIDR